MADFHVTVISPDGYKNSTFPATPLGDLPGKIRSCFKDPRVEKEPVQFIVTLPGGEKQAFVLQRFRETTGAMFWLMDQAIRAVSFVFAGIDRDAECAAIDWMLGQLADSLPFNREAVSNLKVDTRRPILAVFIIDPSAIDDEPFLNAVRASAHAFFDQFGEGIPPLVAPEEVLYKGPITFTSRIEVRAVDAKFQDQSQISKKCVLFRISDGNSISTHLMPMEEAGQFAVDIFASLVAHGDLNAAKVLDLVFKRKE